VTTTGKAHLGDSTPSPRNTNRWSLLLLLLLLWETDCSHITSIRHTQWGKWRQHCLTSITVEGTGPQK